MTERNVRSFGTLAWVKKAYLLVKNDFRMCKLVKSDKGLNFSWVVGLSISTEPCMKQAYLNGRGEEDLNWVTNTFVAARWEIGLWSNKAVASQTCDRSAYRIIAFVWTLPLCQNPSIEPSFTATQEGQLGCKMCQSHLDTIPPLFWCLFRAIEWGKVLFSASDDQPYYDVREKLIIYVPLIRVLGKHQRSDYRLNLRVH